MAVVTDFKEARISNRLIASGLIWGLAFRIMGEGSAGIVHYLVNVSIPVILLFLLFQMRALGAGDIKLFSVAGGFISTRQLLLLIPAAIVAAGMIGVGKLVRERKFCGFLGKERTQIHFSVAILIGYFVVVWGCAIE
ncbi:MAG: prepilin peptidase [Roseburia sp.]|nr:prepilin peptidase [Roseburia sp.]